MGFRVQTSPGLSPELGRDSRLSRREGKASVGVSSADSGLADVETAPRAEEVHGEFTELRSQKSAGKATATDRMLEPGWDHATAMPEYKLKCMMAHMVNSNSTQIQNICAASARHLEAS